MPIIENLELNSRFSITRWRNNSRAYLTGQIGLPVRYLTYCNVVKDAIFLMILANSPNDCLAKCRCAGFATMSG